MHYAWIIAAMGFLVTVLAHGFGRMSYSVILPSMKDGLGLNYTQLGSIATGNFIGYLCLAIVGGFLAARFGVRKVVFISLVVIGVSLFLTGLSNSFVFAFFMRLITGAGNGGSYVPIMALPAAWFIMKRRGLATGIVSAGIGSGLFISGMMLPPIISAFGVHGWRYAWFVLGVIVFVLAFVCFAFLRDNPKEKGLGLCGGEGGQAAPQGPRVTLFSAFRDVVVEPEIWKLAGVYFMYGFSYIIYLTFFVAYLTREMHVPATTAGRIFGVLGIFSIFCGIIYGWLSDLLGRRYGFHARLPHPGPRLPRFRLLEGLHGLLPFGCRFRDRGLFDTDDHGCGSRRRRGWEAGACRAGLHHAFLRHRAGAWTIGRGLYQGRDRHVHICLPPVPGGIPRRCRRVACAQEKGGRRLSFSGERPSNALYFFKFDHGLVRPQTDIEKGGRVCTARRTTLN